MKASLFLGGVLALAALLSPYAQAAPKVWNNLAGGSWTNGANWTPAGVPGVADTVFITNNGDRSAASASTPPRNKEAFMIQQDDGGREWTIHLTATAPAGGWNPEDTSVYNVVPKAGTVRDSEGHIAPVATLTTFTVATTLWTQDFDDTSIGHGFSLATGWQTGLVNGIGGAVRRSGAGRWQRHSRARLRSRGHFPVRQQSD